ncbi:MAG: LysR family transcriptional regulator [Allorhizobium sp.]
MDFRQLRNLVLVGRYASFGVAAEKLNLTQPALSKSIRALEQSVGVKLLDRGPWGVKPTVYGTKLIEYGELVLALALEAENELDAMRGARRGTLRIGATTTAMRELVPMSVKGFLANKPEVDVSASEELNTVLYNSLLSGALDVVVMAKPHETVNDEIELRKLMDIPIDIVADRGHELASRSRVGLADLVPYFWIMPPRPEPDRLALESLFSAAQLPRPRAACETTSSSFQMSMIANSQWLSYLTRTSIFTRPNDARFVPLKLDVPTWTRNLCVGYRRRGIVRPTVLAFLNELEVQCARLSEISRISIDTP